MDTRLGRDLSIGVRGWDRRMYVVSMRAAMVSGRRRTSLWLLRLRIADPESCQPGGGHDQPGLRPEHAGAVGIRHPSSASRIQPG